MEFTGQQPIYLQIAELICENILLRTFREDERIPSVREMAIQLEVNPNTVMRTYEYLQGKNIITNKRGVGYFVAVDGIDKTTCLKKKEFMETELPKIFKTVGLLNISMQELLDQYHAFIEARNCD